MSHFGGPLLAASWPNVAAVALDGVQKQMRAAPNIRSGAPPIATPVAKKSHRPLVKKRTMAPAAGA